MEKKITLRSDPLDFTVLDIRKEFGAVVRKYNFFTKGYPWNQEYANEKGDFKNDFQDNGDGTVTDKSTGLMWQKLHRPLYGRFEDAKMYVEQLNRDGFAGFRDWRLPTIEELTSLMDKNKSNDELYISPLFSPRFWVWSCDIKDSNMDLVWCGNYLYGTVFWINSDNGQDIRAVRTATIPPGRQFYLDHLAYLSRGDFDGLLRDHYHEDAEMVTFEFILKGHEAIKKYLTEDAPRVTGKILGVSLDYFAESDDVILYKASVKTEKFGTIKGDDAFYLKDGKILRHIALTISPKKTEEWALK